MPFKKGNQLGKLNAGKPRQSKKTIWLMESLKENGYDYEKKMIEFLKAQNYEMANLLLKMLPYIANAPKHDVNLSGVETLVINRYVPRGEVIPSTDETKNVDE